MSSRLLKKFLKEKSRDEINKISKTVEEKTVAFKHKKKSVFVLLEDSEDSKNRDETDDSEDNLTNNHSNDRHHDDDGDPAESPQKNVQGKREETKRKGKMKESQNTIVHDKKQNQGLSNRAQAKMKRKKKKDIDEEIDNILHSINAQDVEKKDGKKEGRGTNETGDRGEEEKNNGSLELLQLSACTHDKYNYCLKLEKSNFDVNVELKRIFGKDFVKEKKFIQKSKIKYLKNWLIQDYTTKTVQPPLGMKRYENEFRIEKYKLYLEAENLFYLLLDSYDIEAMHNLLRKFPFHIDTLLVLSEYYNESNNYEMANKFIKLSLLLLQNIFHIDFHPNYLNKNRNIFVNPYLYDNKALYKSLYMHMLSLENEACTITALEISKLLCKMDLQNDLCSILLRIDSLILKCNFFDFLLYFSFNFVIQNVQYVLPQSRMDEILSNFIPSEGRHSTTHHLMGGEDLKQKHAAQISNLDNNPNSCVGPSSSHGVTSFPAKRDSEMGITGENLADEARTGENLKDEDPTEHDLTEKNSMQINRTNVASSNDGDKNASRNEKREHIEETSNQQNSTSFIESEQSVGYHDDMQYKASVHGQANCIEKNQLFDNFEIRLHFILPNFAFSIPLCMYLKNNNSIDYNEIRAITVEDIISAFSYEECKFLIPHFAIHFDCYTEGKGKNGKSSPTTTDDERIENEKCSYSGNLEEKKKNPSLSFTAHLTLLRALLCFPNFLSTFLNYNNFKTTKVVKKTIYEISFKDILSSPPFSTTSFFDKKDNETVQKLISCYLEKNNIYYKSEKIITWFHVCSAFLHEMYKDQLVAEALENVRFHWSRKTPVLDINKYKDVRVGEFKSNNYLLPDFMMEKNRTYSPNIPNVTSNYYVSLNSNLIITFFQSLLPWYQVDYYGTHSRPVYFSTLLRNVISETRRLFNLQ
ncbi:transcription factor 25 [Plasmodium gonderi]|uniref:Transcription factor 25 n=1 Tax=Plasmodium gonderi TaxID=77519 RepID=A0A1Y1JJV9_PLAGO|nr:transcription factor 25 [Plasmodium gonderi]GAW81487.1 transcription factor 25 [Plasmodium gonderi]